MTEKATIERIKDKVTEVIRQMVKLREALNAAFAAIPDEDKYRKGVQFKGTLGSMTPDARRIRQSTFILDDAIENLDEEWNPDEGDL